MSTDYNFNERRQQPDNSVLWEELRYIRKKVDGLETKVLLMFGSVSAIAVAVAIYEVLTSIRP